MTLLFTLLTLAVLGVIAAVATGKIAGGLEEPSTSLPPSGLPDGPVTPEVLDAVRFSPALRGYRMEEVDAVFDILGEELARRDQEILRLSQELRLAERSYLRQTPWAAANPGWAEPGSGAMSQPVPGTGSQSIAEVSPVWTGDADTSDSHPGGAGPDEPYRLAAQPPNGHPPEPTQQPAETGESHRR